MYCTRRINDDYTWVGADGRRLAMFEGVFDVPAGISFNSYLLRDEKTVLFDTTDAAVRRTFRENLLHALEGRSLDCVVVHHMEPDHTAELEELVLRFPEVQIYCSAMAKTMMTQFFGTGLQERIHVVKEGDTLCTGRHTLRFIAAPMVHWPEAMVSFDLTTGTLFSADAFGSFGALGGRIFNDEVDFDRDWLDDARRYYTNIVGKYGPFVMDLLGKASQLDIKMICPLHGPVWRNNIKYIVDKYIHWATYEPEEKGVLLVYASMYGNTESTASVLAAKLAEKGMTNIAMYDVSKTDISYLISDAFKYSHLVLASVTYNLGIYPKMLNFLEDMKALNLQKRIVGIIENGSWACTVGGLMTEFLENNMKAMTVLQDGVTINSRMTGGQERSMNDLVDGILNSMKEA